MSSGDLKQHIIFIVLVLPPYYNYIFYRYTNLRFRNILELVCSLWCCCVQWQNHYHTWRKQLMSIGLGVWCLTPLSTIFMSVILWRSFLLVEETGVPWEKKITDLLQVTDIEYTSPWAGFTLTLVVMHTDCTGRCKPVYYTIMTMTALWVLWQEKLNRYTCTKLTSETTCLGIVSGNVRTWGWITWQQPTCRIKLVDRNRWP